ncbi:hypothetical protein [Actinomadura fibrosa]|uniref:Uncharacterized protein n=1 Tax=Actinomadura fibrosa TaxID=111802 RepID=A0ABW2XWG4_9ACTN|nr:hypothetical protein [Actinomadura fibrosa]
MGKGAIKRVWYRRDNGTVRAGETGRPESLTDMESHLLPLDRIRTAALHTWGVADGLTVRVRAGSVPAVLPGSAVDSAGRLIAVVEGGPVIVDFKDPNEMRNVPTVVVGPDGAQVPTAGATGACLLTLTWREVVEQDSPNSTPYLLHAPWLRLVPAAGFTDDGRQVVLAAVTIDDRHEVTGLDAGPRRVATRPALQAPVSAGLALDSMTGDVWQQDAAWLEADPNGDVRLTLLSGAHPRPALRVTGSGLRLPSPSGERELELAVDDGGGFRLTDHDAGMERLFVDGTGRIGIGARDLQRIVHVEGTEVHSGGPGGGYSFADRDVSSFVEHPGAGERWVWYAGAGYARLWSGWDRLTVGAPDDGGALDVPSRMRVRQGRSDSAGIWFSQNRAGDRAFVGMASDQMLGWYGAGCHWGLQMNVDSGELVFGRQFGNPWGPAILTLWGSRIWDQGDGILFLQSGGGIVRTFNQMEVYGPLLKAGGGFQIDHPLDPGDRYLAHSFVESPDMLNVYCGTAVTGDDGRAEVALPAYFAALNRDHRFQLTPSGVLTEVAGEITGDTLTILTGRPGVTVCWQVTGVRQDKWAEENRIETEPRKAEHERGRYLHPELHGEPAHLRIASPEPE